MDQERIAYLFRKYYDKSADFSEREELMQFVNTASDEEITALLEKAFAEQQQAGDSFLSEMRDDILSAIFNAENKKKRFLFNSRLLKYTAAAAVFLIAVITGILTYRNITIRPSDNTTAHQNIAPGGDKATLTLADGSVLSLDDIESGSVAEQSGIVITKTNNGQLRYTLKTDVERVSDEPVYNTISTPRGGQFQIVLPDGTHVWLNSASSLRYPVYFNGTERKVELAGEGYFEVAKNKQSPFKVTTRNQVVTVLGTRFNINSYQEKASIMTTLLEGSVKINTTDDDNTSSAVFLSPGQQAQVNKDNDVRVVYVNAANAAAWKNGLFQFEDTDIQDVMQEFSRWYDVDFEFEGDGSGINLKGRIYRNVNAVEALEILSYFNLKYRIVYSSDNKAVEKIIVSRN